KDVLLLRPGAIGDGLLTAPALHRIRACRPEASVLLVAHPAIRALLLLQGLVDDFISQDSARVDALFAPDPGLARARWPRLDAAMLWVGSPADELLRNVTALGANPVLIAPSRPRQTGGAHAAQHLIDSLAPLGVYGRVSAWSSGPALKVSPGRGLRSPTVVVHPGSGSLRKNWP